MRGLYTIYCLLVLFGCVFGLEEDEDEFGEKNHGELMRFVNSLSNEEVKDVFKNEMV